VQAKDKMGGKMDKAKESLTAGVQVCARHVPPCTQQLPALQGLMSVTCVNLLIAAHDDGVLRVLIDAPAVHDGHRAGEQGEAEQAGQGYREQGPSHTQEGGRQRRRCGPSGVRVAS
jgi:hypothetical protein